MPALEVMPTGGMIWIQIASPIVLFRLVAGFFPSLALEDASENLGTGKASRCLRAEWNFNTFGSSVPPTVSRLSCSIISSSFTYS